MCSKRLENLRIGDLEGKVDTKAPIFFRENATNTYPKCIVMILQERQDTEPTFHPGRAARKYGFSDPSGLDTLFYVCDTSRSRWRLFRRRGVNDISRPPSQISRSFIYRCLLGVESVRALVQHQKGDLGQPTEKYPVATEYWHFFSPFFFTCVPGDTLAGYV
ncbi:uncharacterized protein BT62DRAFT_999583 [Guyanagaster necrorhizus]|uniref:Uncharacterized protein n=1 Tax=Guyanagaster necrorhizus TaxID=856835 RepID=A0A9P7W3A7_9AGAR|nr:uncharacterized protein BT62DRAFT_999583 [Guyanagaster necrorhizus MCA 3950]KAG7451862.1 hypothetical protein BT62DRAFT_999583 [Guyanagaster necrorhizus MCA 3950]